MDMPVEKKFKILCEITRAQHFAWREAVEECFPGKDVEKVVYKMWEVTGHETAKAYLRRLDPRKPLPRQVAESIAWSSVSMGEDAEFSEGRDDSEAFVTHSECPWYHWHSKLGLLPEDQPGCDTWFQTIIEDVNKALGSRLKIETTDSLPGGGPSCVRRIWTES